MIPSIYVCFQSICFNSYLVFCFFSFFLLYYMISLLFPLIYMTIPYIGVKLKSGLKDMKKVPSNMKNEFIGQKESKMRIRNNISGKNMDDVSIEELNKLFADEYNMFGSSELQSLSMTSNETETDLKGYDTTILPLPLSRDKGPESEKKVRKLGKVKIVPTIERANLSIITPSAVIDKIWYPNDRQKQFIIGDVSDLKSKAKGDESSVLSSDVDGDCVHALLELRDNYITMVLRHKLICLDLTDVKMTKFPELIPFIKGPKASGTASRRRVEQWGIPNHMKYMREEARVSHNIYMFSCCCLYMNNTDLTIARIYHTINISIESR